MFMAQAWSVLVAASSEQSFPRRKTSLVRALCSRPACGIPQSCRADSSAALSWRCLEIHLPMHLSPPQLPQSVLHLIRLRRFLSVRLCSCSFYSGHFSQPAYNALLPDILFLFLLLLLFVLLFFGAFQDSRHRHHYHHHRSHHHKGRQRL